MSFMFDVDDLDRFAAYLSTERREDETDDELRSRLLKRMRNYSSNTPNVTSLVNIAEMAILHDSSSRLRFHAYKARGWSRID